MKRLMGPLGRTIAALVLFLLLAVVGALMLPEGEGEGRQKAAANKPAGSQPKEKKENH